MLRTHTARAAFGIVAAATLALGTGSAASASATTGAPGGVETTSVSTQQAKYYKNVWKVSNSFTDNGLWDAPSKSSGITWWGRLGSGTNYFYCQTKTDVTRQASEGKYVNNWWLLTDDDWGNKHVWVNAVNVSGGGNYERIPGVPLC
ncbi:hypothetical protein [Nesterenkonia halobia]